jgi:tetratricopeptide (TPR) repeat protein
MLCEEALDQCRRLGGNVDYEAEALCNLGEAYIGQNRPRDAADCLRRSAELFHAADDPWREALAWKGLGLAHRALGDESQALDSWRRALAIVDDQGGMDSRTVRRADLVELIAGATDPSAAPA